MNVSEFFQKAMPFPYLVINNFLRVDWANELANQFPKPGARWYVYDNELEKKLAMDKLSWLPLPIQQQLKVFNSPISLAYFEKLTGMTGLIGDASFRGGGCHQILPGGKLDIHEDFNIHPGTGLKRRLNAILFLNKDWKDSYGGHLEFWDKEMTKVQVRIAPTFNTLVVFDTDGSNHGHPDPLACPEGMTRKSLAVYYYSKPAGNEVPHSTVFKKRPQDYPNPALDELRAKRAKARITSNV